MSHTTRTPCMSCGSGRGEPAPARCLNPRAHIELCTVAACRGVVRTRNRVMEDGDVEPYGYCSTCGHLVTN